MEAQQLLYAIPQQRNELTDMAISIVQPLKSPYNLFLNSDQLLDPDQMLVYFFIYTLGSTKLTLWGVYNKTTQEFMIDGGCRYDVNNLMAMVKTWKSSNFAYTSNIVKNRPATLINRYLGKEGMKYSDYSKYKYILSFIDGEITEETLNQYYPNAYIDFINEFERLKGISEINENYDLLLSEYIADINDEIRSYEKSINLIDRSNTFASSLQKSIIDIVNKISERFKEKMETGYFQSSQFYDNLSECPNISKCHKNFYESGCEVHYYGDTDAASEYLNPDDPTSLR